MDNRWESTAEFFTGPYIFVMFPMLHKLKDLLQF